MPPFRDPNRLFYDPANPVMLSEDEVMQLSPQELQAAMDQLDQNLVLVLQQIEENFAACNQVVLERILPAVEQHEENSARIFQSIEFWKPFFEAAASTRLDPQDEEEGESYAASDEPSQATASPNHTISDEGDITYGAPSVGGTPRAPLSRSVDAGEASTARIPSEPLWSNETSQQDDLRRSAGGVHGDYSTMQKALPEVQRLRLRDLPPDSPDVPEPHFETVNVGNILASGSDGYGAASPSRGKGKGRAPGESFELSSAGPSEPSFTTAFQQQSPARAPRAGGDKTHSQLLQKILRKNLDSPARPPLHHGPGSSTPGPGTAKKLQFPHDVPKNWDGIANLSQTSLDAFASPIKRRTSAASSLADNSFAHVPSSARSSAGAYVSSAAPPSRTHPSLSASTSSSRQRQPVPPSPAFTRTPAKEAACRTAQNVYNALDPFDLLDSPVLEPPSALKNPATMVYRFDPASGARAVEPDSPSDWGTVRRPNATLGDRSAMGSARGGRGGMEDESYNSLAQPSFANASHTQAIDFHTLALDAQRGNGGAGEEEEVGAVGGSLADFGGGTTTNIDELLAGHTMTFNPQAHGIPADYAGITNDDDDVRRELHEGDSYTASGEIGGPRKRETDSTFTATGPQGFDRYAPLHGGGEDDDDEEEFRAVRLPGQDGPEDTLFGMGQHKAGGGGGGGGAGPVKSSVSFGGGGALAQEYSAEGPYEEEDSFIQEARRSGFQLHGLSEMETLHGGELLASEPFQASPLAGRSHQ